MAGPWVLQDRGWSYQEDQPCDYRAGVLSHVIATPSPGRGKGLEMEVSHLANDPPKHANEMRPQ